MSNKINASLKKTCKTSCKNKKTIIPKSSLIIQYKKQANNSYRIKHATREEVWYRTANKSCSNQMVLLAINFHFPPSSSETNGNILSQKTPSFDRTRVDELWMQCLWSSNIRGSVRLNVTIRNVSTTNNKKKRRKKDGFAAWKERTRVARQRFNKQ